MQDKGSYFAFKATGSANPYSRKPTRHRPYRDDTVYVLNTRYIGGECLRAQLALLGELLKLLQQLPDGLLILLAQLLPDLVIS